MPQKNNDLHGNVPDNADVALLLVDVINDFAFPEGELLFVQALPMARRLAALKRRAKAAGIPVVYVNDNFGKWQSDLNKLLAHCLDDGTRGEPVARLLQPEEDDYFVLKPKHSGFFSTTLDLLLRYLGVGTLILTGVAGNSCILFTASDAYLRDFNLYVPADCVASNTAKLNRQALAQMATVLKADLTPSTKLDLAAMRDAARQPSGYWRSPQMP